MNTRRSTKGIAVLALSCLWGAGCTGRIGEGGTSPAGAASGAGASGSGAMAGAGSGTGTVVSPPGACAVTDVDPTALRRLTNAEYVNTVSDLLGDVSSLNLAFTTELTTEGFPFLDNAAAQQTPPALAQQYLTAAEKVAADTVTNRLSRVLTCDPATAGEQACANTFISTFASKAFRRPVAADQTQMLLSIWQVGRDTGGDFKSGVQAVITAVLQMPEFLYRFEMSPAVGTQTLVPLDGWDMATRLSYLLWNSGPDDALLAAAQAGKLQTAADISAQVMRMTTQPRARQMVVRFHDEWLQLASIATLEKNPMTYPNFSTAVATAMQQEVRSLVDAVVFQGDGKIGSLFTAPYTFMNDVLGKFYGVSGLSPTFARVDQTMLGMRPASGILTAGGLLAAYADRDNTSPTKRGKFIREALLCETLPPPPPNANITPPVAKPNQTRRQALANHETDPTCAGCHKMMDPVGLGFEGFDASGAPRATEAGLTVDTSGLIMGSDVAGSFNGPAELGAKLARSDEALACATTQWFRFAFGRDSGPTSGDTCAVTQLHDALKQGGELALVLAIPQTAPFLYRKVPQGGL
jgi:hypothetical protein